MVRDVGNLVKLQEYLTTLNLDYALTAKLGLTLRAQAGHHQL